MSVRRWALEDYVLAAVCVAAITLGVWPAAPIRQMIHCHDLHGNTSSFSLNLYDPRLGRLRREIERREHPPAHPAVVLAKWRVDLAGHYVRRCEATLKGDAILAEAASSADAIGSVPVFQVSFRHSHAVSSTNRELEFWKSVVERSQSDIMIARETLAKQIAAQGPPPVALGEVFTPPKSGIAWITAILFGLLASCVFAEWRMRAPAIEIVRSESVDTTIQSSDSIRIEIPITWMKIHQPSAVWARRITLAALLLLACVVVVSGQ